MRYEDASNSFQGSGPNANDDSDQLPAGAKEAATGNLITGEGTQYGAAGADSAAGGHITSIAGKGGEDSSFAGGKLSVAGEFGKLTVDAEGNYNYRANSNAPENVRDRFTYTLADNQGGSDTAALVIEIGKTPVVIKAGAQQIVPGPDGVVTLPPGVQLSDVMVVGRNLVINMPDGTQLIIVDGAVFVPQLVLDGVQVPATNVAALLIGQEPQPAAGELPPSSGGNFALPPPPLDPGVPLGDLLPPTVRDYIPPEPQEVFDILDEEPEVLIQPDGQPASVAAVDSVDEDGLPTRNEGEPEGSDEGADGNPSNNSDTDEATAGTIIIDAPDGVGSVTINGEVVTGVIGQEIDGQYGTLTITGFSGDDILYSYVLADNTSGDNTQDDFEVILTDSDGDVAVATLTIDIIDDVPTARDDTDAVIKGDTSTDGNVMSGVGTTSAPGGVDTVGADDAEVTGVHAGVSGSFTNVPDGGVTVVGTFGDLTINSDGSYTYTLHEEVGDGGTDVFTYQLTDGDGDTDTATLTITVPPDLKPTVDAPNVGEAGTIVDEAGLPARPGEPGEPEGSGEEAAPGVNGDTSEITTGTINFTPGDTPATVTINGVVVTGIGQTFAGDYGTLTITGFNANGTINYSYVLEDNVDHDTDLTPFEEFDVVVTDVDGDSASDTLRIDIIDDVPTARPDTDNVGVGGFSATGNVITDAAPGDEGDTDTNAADTVGADDAVVTFIDSFDAAAGADVPDGGFVDIAGEYGTLRIYSNGDYEYTRDAEAPGGVEDVFNYTITDGDGDTSTTTLTITIPDTPVSVQFGTGVTMDDDALPGGNPGGVDDQDPDSSNTAGVLDVQGGDGTLTFALRDIGAPPGFTYELAPNGDLLIKQGGVTVVTVTLDPATGAYTFTQNNPIDHPAGSDENDSFFNITVRVTDADGDFAEGSTVLTIDDDTPELNEVVAGGDVTLDESNAGSPAGFPISDNSVLPVIDFNALFGADGAAAVNATVFGLALTGGPGSGIQTAVGDFPITLVQIDGDTIEGHYNGSNVAFIIQMESDGTVTLTQNVPLEHLVDGGPGPAHDDALDLGGLIAATVTITDGDGDEVSAQVGIGDNLVFRDDGPDAQVNEEATLDQLVLDETTPPGTETDGDSSPPGLTQTTANFANNFVGPVDYGADGPGTVAYSLALSANGIGSGLFVIDPSDISAGDGDGYGKGAEITLSINGAGTLITGSQGGNDYFTISIDPVTGVVTFTQLDNIWHANTGSDDDTSTLTTASPANVQVVQTVTDSDGDFDTAAINVGAGVFHIEDDGPVATNDVDNIVSGGDTAVGNVITGVGTNAGAANADDVGADTPGRVTQISGFGGSDSVFNGGVLEIDGQYGTLVIEADGDYTYTRFDGAPGNVQDVFTYTLTDADGDTDTGTLTINIGDAAPDLPDPALILLDDDVIPGKNGNLPDGPGDDNPDNVGGNVVNGQLAGTGGDGTLTYNFTGVNTLPTGFTVGGASDADTLFIVQMQNGNPVTVMTIQLDQSDGSFTVTQNNPAWHPADNGGPDDDIENNLDFSIGVEVEDADGDTDPAAITIRIDDDTPTIDVTKGDDSAVTLTTDDAQTAGVNSDTAVSTANFSGVFGLNQSAGADGAAAAATLQFTLDVTGYTGGPGGVNSGLESHDADIFLYEIGGKVVGSTSATLIGVNAGNTVFDVGVASDGVVTLTQYQQIDHDTLDPTPTGTPFVDHVVSLSDGLVTLTASASLTDNDGDTVSNSETANIGANLRFTDDGPSAAIAETGQAVSVDESVGVQVDSNDTTAPAVAALFAGVTNTGTDTHLPQYAQNASAVVNSTGSAYGADGAGTTVFSLNVSSAGVNSGLNTTAGQDILLYKEGSLIVGRVSGGPDDGKAALAIAIDPVTGVISTVEYLSIQHPDAANPDDSVSIADGAVLAVVTVTDFDGDTATQQVGIGSAIQFQDSGPVMTAASNINIQNSGDVAATGTFAYNLGADDAPTNNDVIKTVTFSAVVNGNTVQTTVPLTQVSEDANSAVFSFSFTYSTGTGTATEDGTITFWKSSDGGHTPGTYTVDLEDPISGVTTLQTALGQDFTGYVFNTATETNSQPDVSVTQITNSFFVQFTGFTAGNGDHELIGGGDTVFNNGELFSEGGSLHQSWVSATGSSNGVAGDTVNGPDGLNFNLYSSDPQGFFSGTTGNTPTASADSMFLRFDGIDSGDDLVVVLKLWADDGDGVIESNEITTKAIVVEGSDIFFFGSGAEEAATLAALAGTPFQAIAQGIINEGGSNNNDGLVIIESSDYNVGNENYKIVGAQIINAADGITGTGIDLDGAVGAGGESTGTAQIADVADDSPLKITNIGFTTPSTVNQSAELTFNVTVQDGDGDTVTQTVTATVTQNPDSSTPISLDPGVVTIQSAPVESFSLLASDSQEEQLQKTAANSNTLTLATAVAAAGFVEPVAAHDNANHNGHSQNSDLANFAAVESVERNSVSDDSGSAVSMLAPEDSNEALAPAKTSNGSPAHENSSNSLDDSSAHAAPESNDAPAADEGGSNSSAAAAGPVAPTVAMVSAEALQAAANDHGNGQKGGSVEQIVAEALHQGGSDVDAVLANLPGGNGALQAIAHMASPDVAAVSGWHMASHGAVGAGFDMMFKMDVATHHQDAVQPVANG